MVSYKEESMTLLKREALQRAGNYKFMALVGTDNAWKTVKAVLETEEGPNQLQENCVLCTWARNTITVKATRVRSAANIQLEVKRVVRLEVQLRQRVAKKGFYTVTSLWPPTGF